MMFKTQDRNKLKRYLAKKPVEVEAVLPPAAEKSAAYQQLPRQQLEAAKVVVAVKRKSDEPRKLTVQPKKKKLKSAKTAGSGTSGSDGNELIAFSSAALLKTKKETSSTKVDSEELLVKSKKKAKKAKKMPTLKEIGQATVAVDDDSIKDGETRKSPTKQSQKKSQTAAGNHQNKLQQSLSRDVASMIAAFKDKGFVEEDDDDDEDEGGDFDFEDDLESKEVYEEEVEEEEEKEEEVVEELPAKKPKQKKEIEVKQEALESKKAATKVEFPSAAESSATNSEATRRSTELGSKARQTLAAAKFRSLNELLYTTDSKESRRSFTVAQFRLYHQAYEQLASQWPLQPVDYLIEVLKKRLQKRKKHDDGSFVIADVGCGSQARIAQALSSEKNVTVYSYDLHSSENSISVISADMARLPLDSATVDVAVYSLSLMPTNLKDVLREANRILKPNSGQVLIVEVASRFADYQSGAADRRGFNLGSKKKGGEGGAKEVNPDVARFASDLKPFGFCLTTCEALPPNGYFLYLALRKTADAETLTPKSRLPEICLKACLYKAR